MRPRLAWTLGDPAGIGPELVARSLANADMHKVCQPVVVGPMWELQRGMKVAGVNLDARVCAIDDIETLPEGVIPVIDRGWPERAYPYGAVDPYAGILSIEIMVVAADMARAGQVAGIVYGPINKEAMSKGSHPDSGVMVLDRDWLRGEKYIEINYAAGIFTTRVTSHVPFKQVPSLLEPGRIALAAQLLYELLQWHDADPLTVAVAALNPHGGEGGLCGDEEITIIGPGVEQARALGIPAVGPYPADTIFMRAQRGEFHGVVIMYHDQGQIATKLLGFDQGVTVCGGISIVITTPAHGTAFDIAGRGVANPRAFQEAVKMAALIATGRAQRAAIRQPS
jgi:4-hydroxy-L-threonine phosphate dehydrogenase PdxA